MTTEHPEVPWLRNRGPRVFGNLVLGSLFRVAIEKQVELGPVKGGQGNIEFIERNQVLQLDLEYLFIAASVKAKPIICNDIGPYLGWAKAT